jgi:hypothetical protein
MDQQNLPGMNSATPSPLWWQKIQVQVRALPVKAWIVLVLFLVAALFMGLHTAFAAKDSTLTLKVQHGFRSALLSVWIDGELAYSSKLTGTMKKKLGLIPESVQGNLAHTIPLPSGTRELRIRVETPDGSVQEQTVSADFVRNGDRTLVVIAKRTDFSMNWQDVPVPVTESASTLGWMARYTSTLLLTAAGSIISALTGYAIRELPKQIGSRQAEAPKA